MKKKGLDMEQKRNLIGWAFLLPDEAQSEICLFAEAPTMETADEICAFYGREIERLLQKQD